MKLVDRRAQYREGLRQEILDAARELFARDGYEATSIRKIAEKIGASSGILYHYFEDKPAIVAHLVAESFARLGQRMEAIAQDQAPPLDRVRRAGRAYIQFGLEHPHHYAMLFMKGEEFHQEPRIMDVFQNDGCRCFARLQEMTAECLAAGQLREELTDPAEVAQCLWASIHGLVSIHISARGFPFVEQSRLIDRELDILIEGIRRR